MGTADSSVGGTVDHNVVQLTVTADHNVVQLTGTANSSVVL